MSHIPVLTKEVLEYLDPEPNENFVDCTVGQGGHTKLILEKNAPEGKVLGIDLDPQQIENCRKNINSERLVLENDSYSNLKNIIERTSFGKVNGILIDLGMSSWQIDESEKGFSFLKDQPLDMRYQNKKEGYQTAAEIVNSWKEEDLKRIFEDYGEERFSRQIVKKIAEERHRKPIETTLQLVEIIKKAVPAKFQNGKIHCATRVFQALRIAANDELGNLEKVLPQIVEVLQTNGRCTIISFHSLEDRIVKNFLKQEEENNKIKILTKKPIVASDDETRVNPRSRSAKLRALSKI